MISNHHGIYERIEYKERARAAAIRMVPGPSRIHDCRNASETTGRESVPKLCRDYVAQKPAFLSGEHRLLVYHFSILNWENF